jgi:hypothetical protein
MASLNSIFDITLKTINMNFPVIIAATCVPLALGFIWYNPKIGFGKAWMKAADMTEEKMKGANMAVVFGVTVLLSFFMAVILQMLVIHQVHTMSMLTHQPDSADPNSTSSLMLKKFMELYGTSYRTFKHGVLHGTVGGFMLALPIIGINALFERRSFKYIAINAGYWIISMGLMGGILCAFA